MTSTNEVAYYIEAVRGQSVGLAEDPGVASGESDDLLASSSFRREAPDSDYNAALEARMYTSTAIGIIMGQRDCDAATALAGLQGTAGQFNISVLELARGLVTTREK